MIVGGMIAFAIFLYVAVSDVLQSDLDRTLRVQAQQVATSFSFDSTLPEAGSGGAAQHTDIAIDQFAAAGLFVETFDARGRLLARSSNLGHLHLPEEKTAATLLHLAPHYVTVTVPNEQLRVDSVPVVQSGRTIGLVLVAAVLHTVSSTTRTLLTLLVVGMLVLLIFIVLGSGVVIQRALHPLNEMAVVAERITVRQLDQRLTLPNLPTEVARLAATFDAMLDRLDASFTTQRRFVADASHDLRTPLATLHGRSEVLLLNIALDAETRAGLVLMRDEAVRMTRLVANLLVLARSDEGQIIDRQPVELDVLLLEVIHQARARAHGVSLTIGHEDQAQVLGQSDLLKQALLNLIDNALTYTAPGGRVEVSLSVSNGLVSIIVSDTGPGIPATDLLHIFERFYRADRARSRHTGGAGLGLSIVRWIAEAHEGTVSVESTVGVGSTFTLVLPLFSNRSITTS